MHGWVQLKFFSRWFSKLCYPCPEGKLSFASSRRFSLNKICRKFYLIQEVLATFFKPSKGGARLNSGETTCLTLRAIVLGDKKNGAAWSQVSSSNCLCESCLSEFFADVLFRLKLRALHARPWWWMSPAEILFALVFKALLPLPRREVVICLIQEVFFEQNLSKVLPHPGGACNFL